MIDKKYITNSKEPFFELAKEVIKPNSKVLDIGAGNGKFSDYCKRTNFYLFDGNNASIKKLLTKYPNSFYGKLPNLPFEDSFFDVIHCSHVLEHLNPQEVYDTLKEMDRCLTKKGFIIISLPLLWEKFYDDLSHVKPYGADVFLRYLCETSINSLSRDKISDRYNLIKLLYRYNEVFITQDLYNTRNNWFVTLVIRFSNLLYRCGLRKYLKTGYTLVLQKT